MGTRRGEAWERGEGKHGNEERGSMGTRTSMLAGEREEHGNEGMKREPLSQNENCQELSKRLEKPQVLTLNSTVPVAIVTKLLDCLLR
jgi:hypothetical protein